MPAQREDNRNQGDANTKGRHQEPRDAITKDMDKVDVGIKGSRDNQGEVGTKGRPEENQGNANITGTEEMQAQKEGNMNEGEVNRNQHGR